MGVIAAPAGKSGVPAGRVPRKGTMESSLAGSPSRLIYRFETGACGLGMLRTPAAIAFFRNLCSMHNTNFSSFLVMQQQKAHIQDIGHQLADISGRSRNQVWMALKAYIDTGLHSWEDMPRRDYDRAVTWMEQELNQAALERSLE